MATELYAILVPVFVSLNRSRLSNLAILAHRLFCLFP